MHQNVADGRTVSLASTGKPPVGVIRVAKASGCRLLVIGFHQVGTGKSASDGGQKLKGHNRKTQDKVFQK